MAAEQQNVNTTDTGTKMALYWGDSVHYKQVEWVVDAGCIEDRYDTEFGVLLMRKHIKS